MAGYCGDHMGLNKEDACVDGTRWTDLNDSLVFFLIKRLYILE